MRPIDAHALWVAISNYCNCRDDALLIIDKAPTIDTKPVIHAHWIEKIDWQSGTGHIQFICSNCGYHIKYKPGSRGDGRGGKFCDDCGAMMDETETFDMSVKDCLEIIKEITQR